MKIILFIEDYQKIKLIVWLKELGKKIIRMKIMKRTISYYRKCSATSHAL